ncbi:hypothetical protein [Flavobacterium sp. MK4S-17]|nr:hypothetical protein [Flavobacterium sp. MK4S-17]
MYLLPILIRGSPASLALRITFSQKKTGKRKQINSAGKAGKQKETE